MGSFYRDIMWQHFMFTIGVAVVQGLGCEHNCDCGFEWDDADKDVTLRYEVMAGLVGAFSPLVLSGLGFLTYKLCKRPSVPNGGAAGPGTTYPWDNNNADRARRDGGGYGGSGGVGGGNGGPPGYRGGGGGYPTSLYGESDDGFMGQDNNQGQGRSPRVESGKSSRYTNIHRNVKSDLTNQWLRNVNTRRY